MIDSRHNQSKKPKSPLVFLLVIAILVISTLVVSSEYFLRPQIESELRHKIINQFARLGLPFTHIQLSGRDVTLSGSVDSKATAKKFVQTTQKIQGVRQIDDQLLIRK